MVEIYIGLGAVSSNSHRAAEQKEIKRSFMLQTLVDGDFFPEAKTDTIIRVVNERGAEAV